MEINTIITLSGVLLGLAAIGYIFAAYRNFPFHRIYQSKIDLENIFDSIDDPLLVINSDYIIQRANKPYSALVNQSYKDVVGKNCYFILRGRDTPCDDCRLLEVMELGQKRLVVKSALRIDGHGPQSISLAFYPYLDTRDPSIVEHIRDITQLEHLKLSLEHQNHVLIETKAELEDVHLKMNLDIDMARQVHHGLLLKNPPNFPGLSISCCYLPIDSVGGDIYDFIPFGDDKLGIFIGDATGHGLPAAFVGTICKMSIYNHSRTESQPIELIRRLHQDLAANVQTCHYLTCFWGIFDRSNMTLTYVRAGHPLPLVIRKNGEVIQLNAPGTLIGFPDMDPVFDQATFTLQSGDRICLFTDGIYELVNSEKQKPMTLGYHTFKEMLISCNSLSLEKVIPEIQKRLSGFTYKDDYTLIVIEVA